MATALAMAAVGVVVLAGGALGIPVLTRFDPGAPATRPNSAVVFVLLGLALWLVHRRGHDVRLRKVATAATALSLLVASLSMLEYLADVDLHIDLLLFRDPTAATARAARIPTGAILLLLADSAAALLLVSSSGRRAVRASQAAALLAMTGAAVVLLGYAYDAAPLHALGASTAVALPTASAAMLGAVSILCARPDRGVMRTVTSAGLGGRVARRLLPVAVLLPATMGWGYLAGDMARWYDTEAGMALFAVSNTLCFGVLIWGASRALAESEGVQRATQRSLRENEEDLAITLNSIGDGVIASDADGLVTRVNAVAQRLTGWDGDSGIGRPLQEVLDLVDSKGSRSDEGVTSRLVRQRSVVASSLDQLFLVSRDGSQRPVAHSAAPIRDVEGEVRGVVIVFRDVSEERRTKRALVESQVRFARMFESGIIGILVAESEGKVLEANDAFLRTVGYTRAEVEAGRLGWKCITPPEWSAASETAGRQVSERGFSDPFEKEYLRRDGTRVPVLVGVAALDKARTITTIADLTSLKAAQRAEAKLSADARTEQAQRHRAEDMLRHTEEQLRQSQKMEAIGSLAGGIAHDFNNLLSVILSYSKMILDDLRPEDPMHEDLTEVVGAAHRATDLTRQLLAFSRQQVLQPRTLDLNQVLEGMSKILGRIIGEDVDLVLRAGAGIGKVHVDPGQIEQVLLNLVVNARDAMPKGGKLVVETSQATFDEAYVAEHVGVSPGSYVVLCVSDTGTGMDKATQARIFEPFFTTKVKGKGTGLGLATVFGIVKQSGGSVWVYSEVGRGTTFKIYLPRYDGAPEAALVRDAAPKSALRGSETVLLVEDEESVRGLARTILKRSGYRVLEANGPADAVVLCEKHGGEVDLLLTDVVMPGVSGRELVERLRKLKPDLRVLFMSGYTDDTVLRHGVLESEMSFIQKPLLPDKLLAKVREVLTS